MARNEQFIRQHRILQILEPVRFGKTISELQQDLIEDLGLSSLHVRTVKRDLEALQASGIDLVSEELGRGKVWKLGKRAKEVCKIAATSSELIALSISRDLLFPLCGTPYWAGIESFWQKIQDELPDTVWEHYTKYRKIVHVLGMPSKSYQAQHGMLKTLNRAIMEHRVVEIDYQSTSDPDPKTRRIEPYGVVFYQSSLYIVAAANEVEDPENRIRNWKLDRFHKASTLDEWFKVPEDFDLEDFVSRGLGIFAGPEAKSFQIKIEPKAVSWVTEDPWHPDQEIQPLDDGGVLLTVPAVNEMEIIPKVLQLGVLAELVSPPEARETMTNLASEIHSKYSGG